MSRTGPIFEALVNRYYDGEDPDAIADQALTDLEGRADEARKERNLT